MKIFVVYINRLQRWSSCLKEPIYTSLPWCLILSSSIRGVKNVSGLPTVLIHPIIKSWSFWGWGLDFIVKISPLSSKRHCFVVVAIDYSTKRTEAILLKNMIHSRDNLYSGLFYLHQMTWPYTLSSLKTRHDWCVGASRCSSTFLGLEICFLVRKLYQETGGHMLTLKIGTMKVFWTIWVGPVRPLPWTGQTGLDKFVKLQIGLHHCVDLFETIEMHI